MKTLLIWVLAITLFIGIGGLYGGIGWVIAWILEKGLNINVNYTIFVVVGIVIFILKAIPMILMKLYADKKAKEFDAEFDKKWKL